MTDTSRTPIRTWPVLLLAAPAFVAIWGGWVGLGKMTGFGEINLLPGIVPDHGWATINSAITLPIGVETYAAYALWVWLSGHAPTPAVRFAKWSAIGSLALGALGQVAYHLLVGTKTAPPIITVLVACLPVAVLGMGAALAHLLRAGEHDTTGDTGLATEAAQEPVTVPDMATVADTTSTPPRSTTPRPARKTTPSTTSTADRVAKIRAKQPDITQAAVADKLGVSERTVQRNWGPDTQPDTAPDNVTPIHKEAQQ